MGGRMAQEENAYSGGGGGGGRGGRGGGGGGGSGACRAKKIKPKKMPQRGLGVAQLEKIRLEDLQKKESIEAATTMMAKNGIASSSSDVTSFLAAQKFRPNLRPFHSPPPPNAALYRHVQSVPNLEILQETCSVSNAGGGEIASRPTSSPRLWGGGGDYNHHHHHHQHHHQGFAFDPPYDSYTNTNTNTSVLSPPLMPHRSYHFQPPPSSMVQVNSSSGISPSSVLSSHLEPPSNQSLRRNIYATQWIDEDKMGGRKRSYPFSLESPPHPSTHCSFRPSFAASSSNRSDELALCSSGYTAAIEEPRHKSTRGSPGPLLDRMPNDGINGDFLSLAPPSTKSKHHHHHASGYYQEYAGSQMHQGESSGSVKQSFNFFPVKTATDQSSDDGDDGKGDTIDLNLKL